MFFNKRGAMAYLVLQFSFFCELTQQYNTQPYTYGHNQVHQDFCSGKLLILGPERNIILWFFHFI